MEEEKNISFSPPFIDDEVKRLVVKALESGWITTGPMVQDFEKRLKDITASDHVQCVNSWTSGAMLCLKWIEIKPGDEVIMPAYTYAATALSVIHAGGTPVFVDVKEDFNIDVDAIREKINKKTKAIIPVDIGGWPADIHGIKMILEEENEKFVAESKNQELLGRPLILSDSAHSLGASVEGKPVGSLADFTVFSFHAVKNLTTAEGGAISFSLPKVFDLESMKKWFKTMSLYGQTKDAFQKTNTGSWMYDITLPGIKANMPDVLAAIGLGQLKSFDFFLKRRKEIFEKYVSFFNKYSWAKCQGISDKVAPSYHLFLIRLNGINAQQRDEIISLMKEFGIAVNVHFNPLPNLTLFKNMGYNPKDVPVSQQIFSNVISLPIYPQLENKDVERVCLRLAEAFEIVSS